MSRDGSPFMDGMLVLSFVGGIDATELLIQHSGSLFFGVLAELTPNGVNVFGCRPMKR